jgi:hypothetical protein
MNDELKTKLARFLPIWVGVRLEDGKVQGRIEHSFSMDWSDNRVRLFWSGKAYSMLGEHQLDGRKDAEHNIKKYQPNEFVFDALSDDCPLEIDFERWLEDLAKDPGDKYAKRNAPCKVKPQAVWQLRALAAERKFTELEPRFKSVCTRLDEAEDKLDAVKALLNPAEEETEE